MIERIKLFFRRFQFLPADPCVIVWSGTGGDEFSVDIFDIKLNGRSVPFSSVVSNIA